VTPMKIAVLGVGAMGSLFGARLALAGQDVLLIDAAEDVISAIGENGVRLTDDMGEHIVRLPIGRSEDFSSPVDLVMVFTKTPHTEAAVRSAAHLIHPGTRVLSMQNGLGNGDRIAQFVPRDRVLVGVTDWPADLKAPGIVVSHGAGHVRLWGLEGDDSAAEWICGALSDAGMNSRLDADVTAAIWEKAMFNAAMNSVAAVMAFTVGQIADSRDLCAVQDDILKEALTVAKANGVAVQEERVRSAVQFARSEHRSHRPSMSQDILAGRTTEIDSINFAIAERAREAGLSAPVIETLGRLVKAMEARSRG
jgi:2-dehydropantoate 2-reductase